MTPELPKLLDRLREIFRDGSAEGVIAARNRQAAALTDIAEFIESSGLTGSFRNETLQLVNALYDLDTGTVAPLLQPTLVKHRSSDTTDVWLGRAQVAVAFELLRRTGHSRKVAIALISRRQKYLLHLMTRKTKSAGTAAANWHWQLKEAQVGSDIATYAFNNGVEYVNSRIAKGLDANAAKVEAEKMLKGGGLIALSAPPKPDI